MLGCSTHIQHNKGPSLQFHLVQPPRLVRSPGRPPECPAPSSLSSLTSQSCASPVESTSLTRTPSLVLPFPLPHPQSFSRSKSPVHSLAAPGSVSPCHSRPPSLAQRRRVFASNHSLLRNDRSNTIAPRLRTPPSIAYKEKQHSEDSSPLDSISSSAGEREYSEPLSSSRPIILLNT
jgi:hypothetical protein